MSTRSERALEERTDAHVLDMLLDSDKTPRDMLKPLMAYRAKGTVEDGVRTVKVVYKRAAGGLPIGRGFAAGKLGLQGFPRAIRGALARKHYHDVDVENAHPTLLWQLCERQGFPHQQVKRYVDNRDGQLQEAMAHYGVDKGTAKQMFLKVMYGGSADGPHAKMADEADAMVAQCGQQQHHQFLLDVKCEVDMIANRVWHAPQYAPVVEHVKGLKKSGYKSERSRMASALAYVLQTEENRVLAAMSEHFADTPWPMEVLIHDGGCVRKSCEDEETVPAGELRACEAWVEKKTGYRIKLVHKPFDASITEESLKEMGSSKYTVKGEDVLVDDMYGAKLLVSWYPGKIKYCQGQLLAYDDDTGAWSMSAEQTKWVLRKMVTKLGKHMVIKQYITVENTKGEPYTREQITNFGGDERTFQSMEKWLSAVPGVHDDGFIARMADSGMGYLLFTNGILNLATGTFSPGFDPNIFFRSGQAVPRAYVGRPSEAVMQEVERVIFLEPFDGDLPASNYLRVALGRGLAGDYRAKVMYFCVGPTNAGKGVIATAVTDACGLGVVANFNGDQLVRNKNNGQDSAKSRSGIMNFAHTRIAFSNEMLMDNPLDGNFIKSLTSGGDLIQARGNQQNEQQITVRATMFCMVNDIPQIKPFDDAMEGRTRCIEFKYTFPTEREPQGEFEKRGDKDIKDKLQQRTEWQDAIIHLLMDAYRGYLAAGRKHEVPASVKEATKSWLATENGIEAVLASVDLELTGNKANKMTADDVHKAVTNKRLGGTQMTKIKLGRELAKLGLESGDERVDSGAGAKGKTARFWYGIAPRGFGGDM